MLGLGWKDLTTIVLRVLGISVVVALAVVAAMAPEVVEELA